MEDDYPLLDFRKAFLRVKTALSRVWYLITNTTAFESFIILWIIANTIMLAME